MAMTVLRRSTSCSNLFTDPTHENIKKMHKDLHATRTGETTAQDQAVADLFKKHLSETEDEFIIDCTGIADSHFSITHASLASIRVFDQSLSQTEILPLDPSETFLSSKLLEEYLKHTETEDF